MKFTKQELELIRTRMEIEIGWGPEIYSQGDLDLMSNIIKKIDNDEED